MRRSAPPSWGCISADRDPVEGMRELVRFTWRYFLAHPEFLSLLGTENLNKAALPQALASASASCIRRWSA